MSSLLLSLSSKPSLRKLALVNLFLFVCIVSVFFFLFLFSCVNFMYTIPQRCHTFRMFSSSTTNPYLMYRVIRPDGGSLDDIHLTTDILYFDPVKEDAVIVRDKAFPMELRKTRLVGMSHGWGVFNVETGDFEQKLVYVSDYYSPCGSKSIPKIIPLHPMGQVNITQMRLISNAAMSCSPDQSKDFVVAANCLGREMYFFRPAVESKNAHKYFETRSHYFDQSKVMYSKRDKKFYTPSVEGHFLGFWNSCFENETLSQMHELRLCNLPEVTQSEWELLDSCSTTAHFVESPSGQRFLIKWYAQNYKPGERMIFLCCGTKRFMVFREEEDLNMCYTEDIGDLCIFLGNNEPFCVKASSFPGLNPNSIYFAGDGFGVYDIATRKPRSFRPKSPSAFYATPVFPFWIPPLTL